jgi:peroxiredoxin family protein
MEAITSKMMLSQMDKLDIPPVSEFLDMIVAGGGKVYACRLGVDMFKLKKEDLWDNVEDILTVGEFYEHAAGEGSHIIFT